MNSHEVFIHIHQGCFAGTGAIVRLPQCQWSKPDGYGKISQCITTTKHSKAKTMCIFLGIYCTTHSLIITSAVQRVLDTSRSIFFEQLTKDTPLFACEGKVWGVNRECKVWLKFYGCNCCNVCAIKLYMTAIYWESIVYRLDKITKYTTYPIFWRWAIESLWWIFWRKICSKEVVSL